MSAATRMTLKQCCSQAPSQVARDPTLVPAKVVLVVETIKCIVTSTTGSVQPERKGIICFNLSIKNNCCCPTCDGETMN